LGNFYVILSEKRVKIDDMQVKKDKNVSQERFRSGTIEREGTKFP